MNNLRNEIKAAIEWMEDEWRISYVCAYGEDRAVVIWEDGSRNELTWEEHEEYGQDRWDSRREEVYQVGGYCVECVHVDGEVFQDSLENELQILDELANLC